MTDHLGTPLAMVDQGGQRSWQAQTTAYGRIRLSEGTRAECPFRFQGQYEDVETGLYYNRFRYYSPEEGGYISQDPIGLEGGFKCYNYVVDSSISIDPFGLSCLKFDSKVNRFRDSITGQFISRSSAARTATISSQKQAGHIAGTPQNINRNRVRKPTSTWDNPIDADRLTREALEKGRSVPNQPGKFDYETGARIGTGPSGNPQTKIRVHVDSRGEIHAHPAG